MRHPSMQAIADALERRSVATLRFDFPFMEAGRRRVDSREIATAALEQALAEAAARTSLPLWLGGHSFGGRMATHAVVDRQLRPAGLILCSFPLHPAGRPSTDRAGHLQRIDLPMLFLSGTRDALARPDLLLPLIAALPRAELHWLDTADHGYRVLKRSRKPGEDVFDEIARVAHRFMSVAAAADPRS